MAQSLMSGERGPPRRIALLVKNLKMSGGNRVILNLFDRLQAFPGTDLHVAIVPEARPQLGELWNLIACKRRYGAAARVMRARRPVDPGQFDLLISTSRRTLDFVRDLSHPAHVHLFQAVEAWDTENSRSFLDHSRRHRYPPPDECVDLVRQIGLPQDVRYVEQLAAIRRVLAVSDYLAQAIRYAGRPDEVTVCVPPLNISGTGGDAERTIDALFFLRGFTYNGDDVTVAVANALADTPYRVAIVAGNYSTDAQLKPLRRHERLTIVRDPPDAALAALYATSRVVVHPSLCNGLGFIPLEALSFGCAAVASRSGCLISTPSRDPLVIMDRHNPDLYLAEVLRLLDKRVPRPDAAAGILPSDRLTTAAASPSGWPAQGNGSALAQHIEAGALGWLTHTARSLAHVAGDARDAAGAFLLRKPRTRHLARWLGVETTENLTPHARRIYRALRTAIVRRRIA